MNRLMLSLGLLLVAGAIGYVGVQEYLNRQPASTYLDPRLALDEFLATYPDIQETEGVKHLIPLDLIVPAGPAQDGIPPIDDPDFENVAISDTYLADEGIGIDVEIDGDHRFYPYQILVWHEIVNDELNGVPLAITFCPLCYTGIVYERENDETVYDFGTSGKLYNNNLLMYDRQTNSLWSQALGQAVVGERTGTELAAYPFSLMTWADWKNAYPDGEVLSRKTGVIRDYTYDPYSEYYKSTDILFPLTNIDGRLHPKTLVYGLVVNDEAKAYPEDAVKGAGDIVDTLGGEEITITYDEELGVIRGSEPLLPFFWFSWAAHYPQTEIWDGV